MCVSREGRANLGACRAKALRQTSDSEEESLFLLVGRREFNFCQTTSLPHSSEEGRGGQCHNTDSVNGCYFNNQIHCPGASRRNGTVLLQRVQFKKKIK